MLYWFAAQQMWLVLSKLGAEFHIFGFNISKHEEEAKKCIKLKVRQNANMRLSEVKG